MGRMAFGGAAALCVLAAGTAMAAPASRCAKADEVTAIQVAAVQQQLMVAALTCNQIDHFNAFQTGYNADLRASDSRLLKMFRRLYGARNGEAEYHGFKTRLANDSSIRSIRDNATYCQQAGAVFAGALAAGHSTLANFVSSIQVNDESPVQSCELTVTMPISGNGMTSAAYVVPTPNPLRVAMLDARPDAQPAPASALSAPVPGTAQLATAAAVPAAAPSSAPASDPALAPVVQPAQTTGQTGSQPEEKKSGWLSGLFH